MNSDFHVSLFNHLIVYHLNNTPNASITTRHHQCPSWQLYIHFHHSSSFIYMLWSTKLYNITKSNNWLCTSFKSNELNYFMRLRIQNASFTCYSSKLEQLHCHYIAKAFEYFPFCFFSCNHIRHKGLVASNITMIP